MSNEPWFARLREGLFKDPSTNHRKRMGEAVWLYGYLHICADLKTGYLYRTYKTISDESGIPESTVRKMMEKLKRIPPNGGKPYINVRQLSRTLYIQITKWVPPKPTRVPIDGQSESVEGAHIGENGCPSVERVPKSGHPLNSEKNKPKPTRVPIDGQSNKTHITRPKRKESFSLKKSSDSKTKTGQRTNPDIKVAVDHYHDEFIRIHELKPSINRAAGKIFQRLLEEDGRSLAEIKELITAYLYQPDEKLREKGYPVEWFPGHINGLLLQKKQPELEYVW